jgi:hypothetical protein
VRRLFAALVLLLSMSLARAALAEDLSPADAGADQPAASAPVEDTSSVTRQEIVTGALVVGGAFALGVVATGSLGAGLVTAGAVAIIYTVMP